MSGRLTDAYENIKNLYFFINTIWRNGEMVKLVDTRDFGFKMLKINDL